MSNETQSNEDGLGFDKKTYQRELMRKRRAAEKMESSEKAKSNLSDTDKLFEEAMPGYYIFSSSERTTTKDGKPLSCWMCGKGFSTRLELNRFCSPKCKDKFLHDAMRTKPD